MEQEKLPNNAVPPPNEVPPSNDAPPPDVPPAEGAPPPSQHMNIRVKDNNQNEIYFKIKRTTELKKLMGAFCERVGKAPGSLRFLFDGQRLQPDDTPESREMDDDDTIDVFEEQLGGTGPARQPILFLASAKEPGHRDLWFKISPKAALQKLMDAYCKRQPLNPPVERMRFIFNGRRIWGNDTCESLGIRTEDKIEVYITPQGNIFVQSVL